MFLLAMLPTGTTVIIALNRISDQIILDTERDLHTINHGTTAHINEYLNYLRTSAQALGRDKSIVDNLQRYYRQGPAVWDPAGLTAYLKTIQNSRAEVSDLLVLDSTGAVLASASGQYSGINLSSRNFFLQGRQAVFLSDINWYGFAGPATADVQTPTGNRTWIVTAPIASDPGAIPIGVVMGSIDPNSLAHRLAYTMGGDDHQHELPLNTDLISLYLVNQNRLKITPAFSEEKLSPTDTVSTEPVIKGLEQGEEFIGEYVGSDGNLMIGSSKVIPDLQWVAIVEVERELVLFPIIRLRRLALLGTLIVVIVLLLGTIYLTKRVTDPIFRLMKANDALGRGDAAAAVIPPDEIVGDEVGDLMV
ncbi:MAG: cache domain-containing protein, partial [Candidatus Neomarinimicrobiota bacterium]